jgi:hypothetical protein
MSMKEVFRRWNRFGRDPFGDKQDGFVLEVPDTYFVFTEISERFPGGYPSSGLRVLFCRKLLVSGRKKGQGVRVFSR